MKRVDGSISEIQKIRYKERYERFHNRYYWIHWTRRYNIHYFFPNIILGCLIYSLVHESLSGILG